MNNQCLQWNGLLRKLRSTAHTVWTVGVFLQKKCGNTGFNVKRFFMEENNNFNGKHVQSHYLLHPTHSNHTKYESQKPEEEASHMVLSTSNIQRVIGLFDVKAIPKCKCCKYNVDIKSSIHDSLVHQPLFKRIIFALCNREVPCAIGKCNLVQLGLF